MDQAFVQGLFGPMIWVLLGTGAHVSKFVAQRVENVSTARRAMVIEDDKGGRHREVAKAHRTEASCCGLASKPSQVGTAVC